MDDGVFASLVEIWADGKDDWELELQLLFGLLHG